MNDNLEDLLKLQAKLVHFYTSTFEVSIIEIYRFEKENTKLFNKDQYFQPLFQNFQEKLVHQRNTECEHNCNIFL